MMWAHAIFVHLTAHPLWKSTWTSAISFPLHGLWRWASFCWFMDLCTCARSRCRITVCKVPFSHDKFTNFHENETRKAVTVCDAEHQSTTWGHVCYDSFDNHVHEWVLWPKVDWRSEGVKQEDDNVLELVRSDTMYRCWVCYEPFRPFCSMAWSWFNHGTLFRCNYKLIYSPLGMAQRNRAKK